MNPIYCTINRAEREKQKGMTEKTAWPLCDYDIIKSLLKYGGEYDEN